MGGKRIHQGRDCHLERLGKNHMAKGLEFGKPHGNGCFLLSLIDGIQASPDNFRNIGAAAQTDTQVCGDIIVDGYADGGQPVIDKKKLNQQRGAPENFHIGGEKFSGPPRPCPGNPHHKTDGQCDQEGNGGYLQGDSRPGKQLPVISQDNVYLKCIHRILSDYWALSWLTFSQWS